MRLTTERQARQWTIRRRQGREKGQGLVEFALVFPLFIVLTLFIIEFAFVFSGLLGVNYASRNAALIASEAGNDPLADCIVLREVENSIGAPGNKANIVTVTIYRTDQAGTVRAATPLVYTRGGTTTCTKGAVSVAVPYTSCNGALISSAVVSPCGGASYTYIKRCNVLAGCTIDLVNRKIDTIGVEITYNHTWVTPIRNFGLAGTGAALTQSNAMRMEPIL